MNIIEDLKKKGVVFRKTIMAAVLFVLAVPLLVIILFNLQKRLEGFESEKLREGMNLPEFEGSEGLDSILKDLAELEELMQATSTATSTE